MEKLIFKFLEFSLVFLNKQVAIKHQVVDDFERFVGFFQEIIKDCIDCLIKNIKKN